jgi:HemX protein
LVVHIFSIAALVCYSLSFALYFAIFFSRSSLTPFCARLFLSSGVLFHLCFKFSENLFFPALRPFENNSLITTFPETLSLISLCLVIVFLILDKRYKLSALGALVSMSAAILFASSAVLFHFEPNVQSSISPSYFIYAHIISVIAADVFFLFAFIVSISLIVKESLLKNKQFNLLQKKLPAIKTLDRLNESFLKMGFLAMILGVGLGIINISKSELLFSVLDPRLLWSFVILVLYGFIVVSINYFGIRGRRASLLSVIGFSAIIASFISIRFGASGGFHVHF